jgi:two-component system cell cycle response regulator DivK
MKRRILLVEDNIEMANMMQKELEFLGYEVIVAKNGVEAVETATSQLPDLIVMDMVMPTMDGFKATAQVRKNPKTQAIPILAATVKAMPGDQEECLASGCDGYIAKPFTYKELGAAIKKLLK